MKWNESVQTKLVTTCKDWTEQPKYTKNKPKGKEAAHNEQA